MMDRAVWGQGKPVRGTLPGGSGGIGQEVGALQVRQLHLDSCARVLTSLSPDPALGPPLMAPREAPP